MARAELGLRKLALFQHLGYEPHTAQALVHNSRAKRRVVASGVRVGKSTIGVYETVAELLHPRSDARGWLVGPTFETTKRIGERVLMVLQAHMPHRIVAIDARDRSVTVANLGGGLTQLRARSADRPVGLLGESLAFLVVDEAAQIQERVWTEHLAPRLLDCNGSALLLSTPDGGGWFHDEFKRARKDPAYEAWSFPTAANPRIDKALIDAEGKRLPPEVFRAQYLAEFIGVPPVPCDVCHGPKFGAKSWLIFTGREEQDYRCKACNGWIDRTGESAVPLKPDGTVGDVHVVVLNPSPEHPPEMP